MAEFCFDCFNKMSGGKEKKSDYLISKDLDICEGCASMQRVVVRYKKRIIIRDKILYKCIRIKNDILAIYKMLRNQSNK